ncbi:hypothetical protein HRF90_03910 [Klebsiella michiganensis]|nr:hypothetical protein [Klebsiella michiganensis]HBU6430626.1 hypothetical protein [Klebsiella oxytoca]
MDILSFRIDIKTSPNVIWDIWIELEKSTAWDKSVASCRLDGEFLSGTNGICKLKNGLSMPIKIEDIQVGHRWSNSAYLLGSKLRFIHVVDVVSSESCHVMHQADLSQVRPWIWRKILGMIIRPALEKSLINLKYFAEHSQKKSTKSN